MKTIIYNRAALLLLLIGVCLSDLSSQVISHDFNSSANGWTTSDDWIRNSSSFAGNTTNHWHCDPFNNYVGRLSEYVTSGNMDLSGFESMTVSVKIAYKTNNQDGFRLEYNTGSGGWLVLGTNADANWYTDGDVNALGGANDGWGDNRQTNPHWSTFTHTLPASCDDNETVQFRFYFATDRNSHDDGVAFDDFEITGIAIQPLGKDGPGGVGLTNGSDGLALWLDANELSLSNNNNVSSWPDLSGSTNTASAVSGREPTFKTNVRNGFPAVRFTASNTDYLRIADDASLKPASISVFVVGSFTTSSSAYAPFIIKTNNYSQWSLGYGIARTNAAANVLGFVSAWNQNFVSSGIAYSTPSVMSLVYDKSDVATYYDEGLEGTDGYTADINHTTNYLYLGISPNGNGGTGTGVQNPIDGDIYEAFIFGQSVNSAQRKIIHNYLAAKYNIALDANDIYDEDNSGYDYEVAGIGEEADGSHEDAQGTGIVRIRSPDGLGVGEYLIWGHNNAVLDSWDVTDLPNGIQSRVARDWSASEIGEVGDVSISFDLSDVPGSITASDLRLIIDGNGIYATGATIYAAPSDLGGNVFEWTGIDIENNDHFTIGSINSSQTPLPVELTEFKATPDKENNVVNLFWVTSSEINNDYFTVEKTTDLVSFTEVVQTPGQGTTNENTEYRETDYEPVQGVSYYRLGQTDFDGKREYFNLEKVLYELKNSAEAIHVELYPNPNNGHNMFMKIPNEESEDLNVLVNDFIGKSYLVDFTVINQGEYSVVAIEMNQRLAAGSYMINVSVGGVNHSHKLIVR